MKRTLATVTLALAALMVVASPAAAAPPAGKKQWICHNTGKKYVAVYVANKALDQHVAHHSDIIGTGVVPQNRSGARTYCASQTLLTPTRGGTKENTNLSSGSLAATLGLRARLGQGQVCYTLKVTETPAASITVNSVTLTPTSGSPLSLDLSGLTTTGTTPLTLSKCQNVSRDTVKALLQNRSSFTVNVVTTAGTLSHTLGS